MRQLLKDLDRSLSDATSACDTENHRSELAWHATSADVVSEAAKGEELDEVAKGTNADWPWVDEKLEMLGETEGFEEATDTQVREAVFDAIGYDNDTPFYI